MARINEQATPSGSLREWRAPIDKDGETGGASALPEELAPGSWGKTGLPQPSADNLGEVHVNQITGIAEICINQPYASAVATGTWTALGSNKAANLRYVDALPRDPDGQLSYATSADDDDFVFEISTNKFWFGDTAPGGRYAWYDNGVTDSLRPSMQAFWEAEIGGNLGATANVVYLGQLVNNTAAFQRLHAFTVDSAGTYYCYFSVADRDFYVLEDDYAAPGTVKVHYRFVPIKAEPIAPSVITYDTERPDPYHVQEHQLLLESGALSYAKAIFHPGHAAVVDWEDYAGDGFSFPTGASWRGASAAVNTISSPMSGDIALQIYEIDGYSRGFHVYIAAVGNLSAGWYPSLGPFNQWHFLGYPGTEADADALAGQAIEQQGYDSTKIAAYFDGKVQKVMSYTAPADEFLDKQWTPVQAGRAPTVIFWLNGQTVANGGRIGTPQSHSAVSNGLGALRLAWQENPNEKFDGGSDETVTMLEESDVSSDIDLHGNTETKADVPDYHVFTLPAGRWNIHSHIQTNIAQDSDIAIQIRSVQSGDDDRALHENVAYASELDNTGGVMEFDEPNFVTDGTEEFYLLGLGVGGNSVDLTGYLSFEKVA